MELISLSLGNPAESAAQQLWAPVFDPLRDEPRFKSVLEKMGLPYRPAKVGMP